MNVQTVRPGGDGAGVGGGFILEEVTNSAILIEFFVGRVR
jgi:hypothetical protein